MECACLTPEIGKLINKKKLYFPCAFCVLESLNTRPLVDTCSQTKERPFQSSQKLESQKQLLQPTKVQAKTKSEQVIIIDSIDDPSGVSDSRKINEKLKRSSLNTNYVEFACPLAKGGVAVHFKDSYQAEEAINNWPGKVFGEKESVHRPRGNSGSKVGFAKNVDPRYSKQQILQILKDKGCTVSDVKRLFHRYTGRPMPVVKIFHESHEDLVDTINTELGLKFNGKQAYVESERRRKVVRLIACVLDTLALHVCYFRFVRTVGRNTQQLIVLTVQNASIVEDHIKLHQANVQCIRQSFGKSKFKTLFKHKVTLSLNCQLYNKNNKITKN